MLGGVGRVSLLVPFDCAQGPALSRTFGFSKNSPPHVREILSLTIPLFDPLSQTTIPHSSDARSERRGMEAWARIEPAHKGFADPCLTTWLPRLGDWNQSEVIKCFWFCREFILTQFPLRVRRFSAEKRLGTSAEVSLSEEIWVRVSGLINRRTCYERLYVLRSWHVAVCSPWIF